MSTTTSLPQILTQRPASKALQAHYGDVRNRHLRELFAEDPRRGERLTAEGAGLYLDYSKNRVTDETLRLLGDLAEECGLRERIDAMFGGEKINLTENRAVLHTALRAPRGASVMVDGRNVAPEVHAVLDKMAGFCNRVRSGEWQGYTGKRTTCRGYRSWATKKGQHWPPTTSASLQLVHSVSGKWGAETIVCDASGCSTNSRWR